MDEQQQQLLHALADKYRIILQMRAEPADRDPLDARAQMAALAARFPGALRELDQLPLELVRLRAAAIERALRDGEAQPWMRLQISYHGFMRATLRLRRILRPAAPDACLPALVDVAYVPNDDEPPRSRFADADLSTIANPPGGRLNPWVFAQVARDHSVTADDVRRALFSS